MHVTTDSTWRRCSACKKPINYGAVYQVCSVSTCNRARTGLVFCSVACWDSHLPGANHREAWAVEKRAPRSADDADGATRRKVVRPAGRSTPDAPKDEVLIIASRLKDYIRRRSGMSTSDRVLEPLSEIVRRVADDAIESAQAEGRKTVLDRDIPKV